MVPTNDLSETRYWFSLENRLDYLYVRIESEEMQFETAKRLVRRIAEESKRSGHRRILVEIDIERRLSAAERYLVISEFPELGFTMFRIAIFYPNRTSPDETDFTETVMANRGIEAKAFTSLEAAEWWLTME